MFVLYVCSLSKSILSLHSLINNKLENKKVEQEKGRENDKKIEDKGGIINEKKEDKK